MLHLLDNLLRQILVSPDTGLTAAQIGFQPPNADWRTAVGGVLGGGGNALNVYLFDLRENRKLRSNERVRTFSNGVVHEEPAPTRLDCHYLVSAWSPAAAGPALEPTLDEHALLYAVTRLLVRAGAFNPSRVYAPGSAQLSAWPVSIQNVDLPGAVAPADGFNKLAEFWSGMGAGSVWKPALYLIVTVPIELTQEVSGPMVTTTIASHRIAEAAGSEDVLIQIGGQVGRPWRLAVGSANVMAVNVGGNPAVLTVNNAAPFAVGDVVTRNIPRAAILTIAGNDLTLSAPLAGLAVGDVLRIANLPPNQTRVRLVDVGDLVAGSRVVLRGDDAANPGNSIGEEVILDRIDASTRVVTLRAMPARTRTFNLNVAAANAPALVPPASGAWVYLERLTGERLQATKSDQAGRFVFSHLRSGQYQLRAGAMGLGPITRVVTVPSPTGEYDLQF